MPLNSESDSESIKYHCRVTMNEIIPCITQLRITTSDKCLRECRKTLMFCH